MFRVSCGYDTNGRQIVRQKTWTPDKNMTPKQIEKKSIGRQCFLRKNVKKATSLRQ